MDGMSLLLTGLAAGANPVLAGGGWCFPEHFVTCPGGLGWLDCAGNATQTSASSACAAPECCRAASWSGGVEHESGVAGQTLPWQLGSGELASERLAPVAGRRKMLSTRTADQA